MTAPLDPGPEIRTYLDADEQSWLRCLVLSFLGTCCSDDTAVTKRDRDEPVAAGASSWTWGRALDSAAPSCHGGS